MFQRIARWMFALVCCLGVVTSASAQGVQIRTLEARSDGAVYELTATWPTSLKAVLDSTGATVLNEALAMAASRGLFDVGEKLDLPTLERPRVRVLASDYDEVAVAPAANTDELVATLNQAPASVSAPGLERKKPIASLVARPVTYDPEREVLRRYRRMVIAVDYARPAGANISQIQSFSNNAHLVVDRSVLADGIVYKLAITEAGLYRIDRDFLASLPGLEVAPGSIDPNNVKVYGNGGKPLPALNADPRPADLVENAVFARGGGDGSFDAGDEIIFYAAAPRGWESVTQRDSQGEPLTDTEGNIIREWEHYVHPFSNENYYFIKIDGAAGARLSQEAFPGFGDATPLSQITGRHFVDFDRFMWSQEDGTGHTWVSELIALGGGTMQIFNNVSLPGMAGGEVEYRVRAAVRSNPSASVSYRSNGTQLATASFNPTSSRADQPIATSRISRFTQTLGAGATLNLEMQLENQINNPKAAADWARVFYPKALQASNGLLQFHTPIGQTGRFEMQLSGFSSEPQVWDVTEPGAIRRLGVAGSSGTYRVQVEVTDIDTPRELVAFTSTAVRQLDLSQACPEESGCRVANQNLHGIGGYPDFVIVTPSIFAPFANELAEMRRQEGLEVAVIDVQQIYNEFSGGVPDMRAVRDYFKFLYDRAPNEESLLRYALLFGDGHYNYRNLGFENPDETAPLENWIFPFETEESFHPEFSYTSDDYFGLLDDDEGLWPFERYNFTGSEAHLNEFIDIGIGRFTVQDTREAEAVVDKIRHYESPATYGAWRTRYLFIADDALNGLSGSEDNQDLHVQNADVVAEIVDAQVPEINLQKVYGVSYERVQRDIVRLPEAHQDILTAIREGVLMFNYSGHGGEVALAQEELFTIEDARQLDNLDRLPIFITATCSFGRWDLEDMQTAAEELLLNENGGAVALLTTVRTVYTNGGITSLNVGLNYQLNQDLFRREPDGQILRIGDALRRTKNTTVGSQGNNRKFNLLGDPTMRPGLPSHARRAVVQTVNGVPVAEESAPVRALDQITIAGGIEFQDSTIDTGFSGKVNLTVYDARRNVNLPFPPRYLDRSYYTVREDLLWRGTVNVTNGQFSATFVVPKDISYSNSPGRISAYASSSSEHANGITENIMVGGTSDNPIPDSEGPEIEVYLDSEAFVPGDMTSAQPQVIVKLFDKSGINTVGAGVGHEMLLVVDGDEQNAIEIGDLYESEENSFQRGTVTYNFEDELPSGPHTLSVRAWDVVNNSGSAEVEFVVSEAEALALQNVFNYPNPTPGRTRFVFEHNQPVGTPASIQVRIYTLSGRPVRTLEQDDLLRAGPAQITFDGLDDDLDPLSSGIYLYKVRVEVEGRDGERQVSEHVERLAVIR